ncbi:hypothetical protein ACLB2K_057712 [Fragaria x ananassa]
MWSMYVNHLRLRRRHGDGHREEEKAGSGNILNWTEKEDFDPSVINGGVKPNSVLLDLDLKAKIGDFSWQRLETDDEVDRESQVVVVEEEDKGEIEKEES